MCREVFGGVSGRMSAFLMFCLAVLVWLSMSGAAFAQDADMSDDDGLDDDSVTNVQYEDNSQDNDQICAPVVNQYNNIIQGGGQALAGGDAVSAVANEANVTNSVVINCINGDNNVIGGGGTTPPEDDPPADPDPGEVDGPNAGDPLDSKTPDSVMSETIPSKVLPTTGGETVFSPSPAAAISAGGVLLLVSGGIFLWLNSRYFRNV